MLVRAKTYYERVLKLQTGDNVISATLKLSISKIKSDQAKLGSADPSVCIYCSGLGQMSCAACVTNGQSTGLARCYSCKGTGREKCGTCSGMWSLKCSRCSGKGRVSAGTEKRGGAIYKKYAKCSTCSGRGVTHRSKSRYYARAGACPTCSKLKPESHRGTGKCSSCAGKGGSRMCFNCSGSKGVKCTHCLPGHVISPFRGGSSGTGRSTPPKRSKRPKRSKKSKY
jgi:hypothetical protein